MSFDDFVQKDTDEALEKVIDFWILYKVENGEKWSCIQLYFKVLKPKNIKKKINAIFTKKLVIKWKEPLYFSLHLFFN